VHLPPPRIENPGYTYVPQQALYWEVPGFKRGPSPAEA